MNCYYEEYSTCSCTYCKNYEKKCTGAECECFVSEEDYFTGAINGKVRQAPEEDPAVRQSRINSKLSLGKTKKQLKYEARKEAQERGDGQGYSLKDDPRFKDLFK